MESINSTTAQCLNLDFISNLPQNIIDNILSLLPIRDALRTSVLSTKWRYCWRSMPKLVFTNNMVNVLSSRITVKLLKSKLVNAIFHVLLFHNGPAILKFDCSVSLLHMESEFTQIISYLAKGNTVKRLTFIIDDRSYKLPISFFSLQGLERIHLQGCTFEPPLTFSRFSVLKSMTFGNVEVSAEMLQRFLSNCPLLKHIHLIGHQERIDFVPAGKKFTFFDLLQCVPLIQVLDISKYYSKYMYAGGMPHKLPASLVHLKDLLLYVCLTKQNEISFALSIVKSSPALEKIVFQMYDNDKLSVQQTPANFLDPEGHPDLNLDHLETLVIEMFSNLPLEMEFVKLIMAKSPVLKKVRIELNDCVSFNEELKLLKDLVRRPFLRASPSANLIFVRP